MSATVATGFAGVSDEKLTAYGAFALRVVQGGLFVAHGAIKLFVFTPAGTAGYFEKLGLPGALGYLTILVEILGGVALLAGVYTRVVALALLPVILGAWAFAHASTGFLFSSPGGGWEFLLFWSVALVAQALIGGGAWAVRK